MTDDYLHLDQQLCFALYAASKEVTKLYQPLLAELGLTYTQYITLLALWEKDNLSVKELGSLLFLDSGTLTPLLKKLETMGYVKRERSLEDERTVKIILTTKGTELKEKAKSIPQKIMCKVPMDISKALILRQQLQELLHSIQESQES